MSPSSESWDEVKQSASVNVEGELVGDSCVMTTPRHMQQRLDTRTREALNRAVVDVDENRSSFKAVLKSGC